MTDARDPSSPAGAGLSPSRLFGPSRAETLAVASAAEGREAIRSLAERISALEGVVGGQAESVDGQLRDQERRIERLDGEICPKSEWTRAASLQAHLQRQIDDLLAGLDSVTRIYGERLASLAAGIDGVAGRVDTLRAEAEERLFATAESVQLAHLVAEREAMRALYESAMSRLTAAESTFRTLQERRNPPRQAERPPPMAAGPEGVAMALHGLVRAAAKRDPDALRAIDGFAADYASLAGDVEALRGRAEPRGEAGRPAFPPLDGGAGPVPIVSILSVGERGFGADRDVYAPLVEAGSAAVSTRDGGDRGAHEGTAPDLLVVHDGAQACDILEALGPAMGGVLCVQCRVAFSPTLDGADCFADVDQELHALGFAFVDLIRTGRGTFDLHGGTSPQSRLLWAEAVYARLPEGPAALPPHALACAASIVHEIYGMYDLAAAYLARRDAATGGDAADAYMAAVAGVIGRSGSGL